METRGQRDENSRQDVRLIAKTCYLEIFNVGCLHAEAALAVRNCSYLFFNFCKKIVVYDFGIVYVVFSALGGFVNLWVLDLARNGDVRTRVRIQCNFIYVILISSATLCTSSLDS